MSALPLEPTDLTALARVQGLALHRQLYLLLRDRIKNGTWPSGSPFPTEEALCKQFGVSRITVRRALADLQSQGLIERRQGLGTIVAGTPGAPMQPATLSFIDSLRKHATETQVRVLDVRRAPPPADIAGLLHVPPGQNALHAVRLRLMDEAPVMMTDAWVPMEIGQKITAAALKKKALYEVLMAQGVQFGRVVQVISAEAADPRRAAALQTDVGAPLLKVVRLIHDTQSRPVQHLTAVMPPEKGRIIMDISGEQINTLSAGYIFHDR